MTFNVLKFWTTYSPDGHDANGNAKMRAVDMVAYAPIGKANSQLCIEAVARLAKVIAIEPGNENIAVLMANTVGPLSNATMTPGSSATRYQLRARR